MTITAQNIKDIYTAGAGATVFLYTFRILENDDLLVYIDGILLANTEYVVTGAGDINGGDITLTTPLTGGEEVLIIRSTDHTQEVDYQPLDPFPADTHEDALDKLTMIVQEQQETFGRALVSPPNEVGADLTICPLEARKNKYLAFDVNGDVVCLDGTSGDPSTVRQEGTVSADNLTVWASTQTIKDSGVAIANVYDSVVNPPPADTGKADIVGAGQDDTIALYDALGNLALSGVGISASPSLPDGSVALNEAIKQYVLENSSDIEGISLTQDGYLDFGGLLINWGYNGSSNGQDTIAYTQSYTEGSPWVAFFGDLDTTHGGGGFTNSAGAKTTLGVSSFTMTKSSGNKAWWMVIGPGTPVGTGGGGLAGNLLYSDITALLEVGYSTAVETVTFPGGGGTVTPDFAEPYLKDMLVSGNFTLGVPATNGNCEYYITESGGPWTITPASGVTLLGGIDTIAAGKEYVLDVKRYGATRVVAQLTEVA